MIYYNIKLLKIIFTALKTNLINYENIIFNYCCNNYWSVHFYVYWQISVLLLWVFYFINFFN